MNTATRWLLCFALLLASLLLTIYEVRDFRRAAEPFEKLTGRPVRAAGGDVGKILGRRVIVRLDLSDCRVTDQALAELQPSLEQLPWLEGLSLGGARVSDSGLAALSTLSQLRSLDLQRTPIGDEALAHLRRLTQLESLDLTGTQVADRGVAQLAALRNLRVLWLSGTKITDACLEDLSKRQQLEIVSVADTQVTEAGVRRLQELLRYCTVIR